MAQSHKPVSSGKWWVLLGFAGFIDVAQIIADFTGVGIAVSEVVELIMPFVLFGLFLILRVPIHKKVKRWASLFGFAALDAITGGIAPFWVLDVWYIRNDIKRDEAEFVQRRIQDALGPVDRAPLNDGGMRKPVQLQKFNYQPKNVDGIRAAANDDTALAA